MHSARRHTAAAALLVACAVLPAALGGCATTQDTAALKQAESKRILEARKHKHKRQSKSHDHGSQER